jgi:hypothetical protein
MKRLTIASVCLALLGVVGAARAADKPNPTGTWKWEIKINDQARELSLKLKQDGDKLTGNFVGLDGKETPIEDATYKDGKLAFKVNRERDGQKFTIKFTGEVSGDTIKGKSEIDRDGQTQTRDWEAKRAKD